MRPAALFICCSLACAARHEMVAPAVSTLAIRVVGAGRVVSEDGQECSASCEFHLDGALTIFASASGSSVFSGWEGACTGTGVCVVTGPIAGGVRAAFESVDCDVSGPSGVPANFHAVAGIRSASLSWQIDPAFQRCPSLRFVIGITSNGVSRSMSTSTTSLELTESLFGDSACFSIVSTTVNGTSGAASDCVSLPGPPIPPGNVLAFAHTGGAVVEWTSTRPIECAVEPLRCVFPVTAYVVTAPDGRTFVADPSERSMFVPWASDGSVAWYTVAARSAVSDSPYPRFSNPVAAPSSVWRLAGFMPEARGDHAMLAWQGFVYLLGGADGAARPPTRSAPINADGTLGPWNLAGNRVPAEASTSLYSPDGQSAYAVTVGGIDANGSALASTLSSRLEGGIVSVAKAGTPLPVPRTLHSSAVTQGSVFVVGGESQAPLAEKVFFAPLAQDGTPQAWRSGPDLPGPRWWTATATTDDRLYVIGGAGLRGDVDEVLVADLSVGAFASGWRATLPMPFGVNRASATIVGDHLYVVAGHLSNKVLIGDLDPSTGEVTAWHDDPSDEVVAMLSWSGREGFGFAVDGSRMFACGGGAADFAAYLDCQTAAIDPRTGGLLQSIAP